MTDQASTRRLAFGWLACTLLAALSFYGMSKQNAHAAALLKQPTGSRMQTTLGKAESLSPLILARESGVVAPAAWEALRRMLWLDMALVVALTAACVLGLFWFKLPRVAHIGLVTLVAVSAAADLSENLILFGVLSGNNPSPRIFLALAALRVGKLLNFALLPLLLVAGAAVVLRKRRS